MPHRDESITGLSLGGVANRLGVGSGEVEPMVAASKLKALETEFTWMVPTSEVERLQK